MTRGWFSGEGLVTPEPFTLDEIRICVCGFWLCHPLVALTLWNCALYREILFPGFWVSFDLLQWLIEAIGLQPGSGILEGLLLLGGMIVVQLVVATSLFLSSTRSLSTVFIRQMTWSPPVNDKRRPHRRPPADLSRDARRDARVRSRHLAFGLAATWLVGIGRYWDHPSASGFQYAGLGSLAVSAALAVVLWLIVKPMRPAGMTFLNVWTFVTLCAPLAALYAVPVERFMPLRTARDVNAWFLLTVAAWRVSLLVFYLRRFCWLTRFRTAVATLLPITGVVTALAALNLERAVFDIMSGGGAGTANDGAYMVVIILALLSMYALPFTGLSWLVILIREAMAPRDPEPPAAPPPRRSGKRCATFALDGK